MKKYSAIVDIVDGERRVVSFRRINSVQELDEEVSKAYEASKRFYVSNPKAPSVLSCCRYYNENDALDCEIIKTAPVMLLEAKEFAEGKRLQPRLDCEDFSNAEGAYLTVVKKRLTLPYIFPSPYSNMLHCFLQYQDDKSFYDPSLDAGMDKP